MRTDIPEKFRKLYARALNGRSQSAAIRSFCLECVGYLQDEVKLCTDTDCPLFPYRLTGRKVPADPTATKKTATCPVIPRPTRDKP